MQHCQTDKFHLIDSEVEPQSGDVAGLAVAANVSQLQLEVVPTPVRHQNLIQAQTHGPGGAAGHWEHQLTVDHLQERTAKPGKGAQHGKEGKVWRSMSHKNCDTCMRVRVGVGGNVKMIYLRHIKNAVENFTSSRLTDFHFSQQIWY